MKKMAVVPQSFVQQFMEAQRNQQQLVSNSPINQLSALDDEMKAILESDLESDVKAKRYNQVLQTYTGIRTKETGVPQTQVTELPKTLPDNVLTGLAKRYVNKGRLLMDSVTNNPDLAINDKNELVYKGEKVEGSNIVDLVHAFSKPTKDEPIGWREFGQALYNNNVPQTAITNKQLFRKAQYMPNNDDVELIADVPQQPSTSRLKGTASRPLTKRVAKTKPLWKNF